jgi:hypothetical protein
MNNQNRPRRPRRSGGILPFIIFAVIIPIALLTSATFYQATVKVPEATIASSCEKHSDRYLRAVKAMTNDCLDAHEYASNAAHLEPTGSLPEELIAKILGLIEDKTSIRTDGTLETKTKDNDIPLTVNSDKIKVKNYTLRISPNGAIKGVWPGYNSEQETNIVVGGQKRTLEELATISMIADNADVENFSRIDIAGKKSNILWIMFFAYCTAEIIAFIAIGLAKRAND